MKQMIWLLYAVVAVLSVIVALQFAAIDSARKAAKDDTCQKFAAFDVTLINLVRQGEQSLNQFAYYKQHPADKQIAIAADERTIRALTPPKYCH